MWRRGEAAVNDVTRRRFLSLAAGAAAIRFSRCALAEDEDAGTIQGTLAVDPTAELYEVPRDFTGLSYESAQLANPAFFSASNKQLIEMFRELSPAGVLRLGGGSSEYTTFSEKPAAPPPFETFGPDTSKTVKTGTVTSALALRNLRAFLDGTGWTCLYGLNLGQGSKENAAAEAEAAHRILGPRLLALQIGNEPDSFSRFRGKGYSPEQYIREWLDFHAAIVVRVPDARFAGPDISNKLAYLSAFAQQAPHHPDVVLLTVHYYAMGPAGNPLATMDNLLSPHPKLTTMKWEKVDIVQDAMRTAHLPCRISEANSCWNGGMPRVSDVFASALWCIDMMLHFASLGIAGVNLHGGGNGWYSPIVGSPSAGFTRRPEFFGIQFAQHFAQTMLLRADLQCNSDRVSAWAARRMGNGRTEKLVALVNKTTTPATIRFTGPFAEGARWTAMTLSAPSLDAKTGIEFRRVEPSRPRESLQLAPHSALLLTSH
jgi:hypothetical protein